MSRNTKSKIYAIVGVTAFLASIATLTEGKFIFALLCAAVGLGMLILDAYN